MAFEPPNAAERRKEIGGGKSRTGTGEAQPKRAKTSTSNKPSARSENHGQAADASVVAKPGDGEQSRSDTERRGEINGGTTCKESGEKKTESKTTHEANGKNGKAAATDEKAIDASLLLDFQRTAESSPR
uniref:Uncharacterized protein n=1 Tax=Craspedostauros australis TaxID=1486917 RepID=A0A7S0F6X3_9STRA|mmetsp:Transcript_9166/g.24755  ORF Transcript_9166/g.24755 Transcript_9166/m.24755 type:complete len:130 (+) Transcript_9166:623-1012(+)